MPSAACSGSAMFPPDLLEALVRIVGPGRVRLDAPLAPFTTFRVGGPADCLVEVRTGEELVEAARAAARMLGTPTVLGGGSNTIVSDRGVRGVVIRVHGGRVTEEGDVSGVGIPAAGASRGDTVCVRADAGVTMNALVRWTIGRGHAGLEAWAGTPGTVGGAVSGNAHYGGRDIADLILSARFLAIGAGTMTEMQRDQLQFSYDHSRFQDTGDVILSALFSLHRDADPAHLRDVARGSLAHRKRTQPLGAPSAGCIFQNPHPARDRVPDGIPWSAGALVDRAGLKGRTIGGASVSATHANFIVSDGTATACDIRALVRLCQAEVRRQYGVELREEVRWLGEWG